MSVINVLAAIPVDDIDAHAAELGSRGVALGEITHAGTVRVAVATDPSGNAITFGPGRRVVEGRPCAAI